MSEGAHSLSNMDSSIWYLLGFFGTGIFLVAWFIRVVVQAFKPPKQHPTQHRAATPASDATSDELDGMNEGDFRNGPAGYAAGVGYMEAREQQRDWDDEGDDR